MMATLDDVVKNVGELVSFPHVYQRVSVLLEDPDSDLEAIAVEIGRDPGLVTRLLRMANSPFYGLSREVDSVGRAISVLGTRTLRDLILKTAASEALSRIPNDVISIDDFWQHSLYCALLARMLAEEGGGMAPETAFLSGLLHDIGQLALFYSQPGQARVVLDLLASSGTMQEAEQRVFGFDHTEVGGALLETWHLPSLLAACARFHHAPLEAGVHSHEAAVIHLANALAHRAQASDGDAGMNGQFLPGAEAQAGVTLDTVVCTRLLATAREDMVETREMLGLKAH